jgi:hypothetical protein
VLGKNRAALVTIFLHDAFSAFSACFETSQSAAGRSEAGQSFGGEKLVAAEETRSGAGGDHAKMPAWHGGGAGIRTARSLVFHPHILNPLAP